MIALSVAANDDEQATFEAVVLFSLLIYKVHLG